MNVSDRSLLITGLFTFLITLGCLSVILLKIGGVGGITGLASSNQTYGYVNITVEPSVAVTLVVDTIDFGDGTIQDAGDPINTSDGDNGGANPGGFDNPGPFRLRNDGNSFVNVTLNGSTPNELLGVDNSAVNYSFAVKNASGTTTGELFNTSCSDEDDGTAGGFSHQANSTVQEPLGTTMSNNHQMVCPNLSYVNAHDEINVSIFFNISSAVGTNTTYSDVLEFLVTSLGHT